MDAFKQDIVQIEGYWVDDDKRIVTALVHLGSWDEVEGEADSRIFYYMDGEPLAVGMRIADDFIITSIEGGLK
jgi:hypothetical protein